MPASGHNTRSGCVITTWATLASSFRAFAGRVGNGRACLAMADNGFYFSRTTSRAEGGRSFPPGVHSLEFTCRFCEDNSNRKPGLELRARAPYLLPSVEFYHSITIRDHVG